MSRIHGHALIRQLPSRAWQLHRLRAHCCVANALGSRVVAVDPGRPVITFPEGRLQRFCMQEGPRRNEGMGVIWIVWGMNSQDLPGALDDAAVAEGLNLHAIKNRDWAIFKTSAIKGEGLFEGLDWLSNQLKTRKR